jgi:hypothetical protein
MILVATKRRRIIGVEFGKGKSASGGKKIICIQALRFVF